MPTVDWIEQAEVKELILSGKNDFLIVDVRDIDFEGGNIKGAINVPYFTVEKAEKLAEQVVESKKTLVIFHCFFCRMRGLVAFKKFNTVLNEKYSKEEIQTFVHSATNLSAGKY